MRHLKLNIDDSAYEQVKATAVIRRSVDGIYGAMDELSLMIITAIENGEKEVTIISKKTDSKRAKKVKKT